MMSKHNILLVSIVLSAIICCWGKTSVDEPSNNRDGKYFNYLRLPEGECYNASIYKCTTQKANMGGADWCIMLFSDALAHCDSDPNCGGYTMSTAEWFHTKYDKNGEVAVHLTGANQKTIPCPLPEWSSYEKQKTVRHTPVTYGKSTCENSQQGECNKLHNYNYLFISNSNTTSKTPSYLCQHHPNNLDNKDLNCVLPIADGINYCNSDDQCQGFMINTDGNWQNQFVKNGMQAVQLFGQGATFTPNEMWRSFKKQY